MLVTPDPGITRGTLDGASISNPPTLAMTEWERHLVVVLSCLRASSKVHGLGNEYFGLRAQDLGFRALGSLDLLWCPIGPTLPEHTELYG